MIPVLLVMAGWPAALGVAVRAVVPTIVLLAGPLIGAFHSTFQELTKQPNYPNLDHRTPWTAIAGHVSGEGRNYAVAGGPGHLISVLLACGVGAWARRWRTRPELLAWSCALVLALGPYTDTVMNPYYVWPALAFGVVVAAKGRTPRFILASACAILTSVAGHLHLAWLPWWLLVVGGMTIVLVAAASPGPVDARVAIETGPFRAWLAEFFEMRPPAILTASSGSNTVAPKTTSDPPPPAAATASSKPKTTAARKTPDKPPRAAATASSGPKTAGARKKPDPPPRAPAAASSRSSVSAVRKKRKGR
jgi:hypothetical protein